MTKIRLLPLTLALVSLSCRTNTDGPKPAEPARAEQNAAAEPASAPVAPNAEPARIAAEAPDFTLPDLDGTPVSLRSFRGKTVVLEWFNPGCPFVKASHKKGSLMGAAKKHAAQGVVWLAVNSGAPGKQGAGVDNSKAGKAAFGLAHPILIDEAGTVGKLYGAERTPHMFVIDPNGVLVYRGAIDNSPDGEGESPTDGKLVRYVDDAIEAVRAGQPVAVAETKAYGCSVKYP